eukprot:Rmarinus@m.29516
MSTLRGWQHMSTVLFLLRRISSCSKVWRTDGFNGLVPSKNTYQLRREFGWIVQHFEPCMHHANYSGHTLPCHPDDPADAGLTLRWQSLRGHSYILEKPRPLTFREFEGLPIALSAKILRPQSNIVC